MKIAKLVLSAFTAIIVTNSYSANSELNDILSETPAYIYPQAVSSADGEYYAVADKDNRLILKYEYKTGALVDTIFNVATARSCTFNSFDGFEMSKDFKRVLLYTDSEPIYRHSFKANYYTYEILRNLVKPLDNDSEKVQIATFSPNGRMVAFVKDANIYLKKLNFDSQSAVTKGGETDGVLYGVTSWCYEEEFGFTNSITWSPDNSSIAFLRCDQRVVNPYTIQLFEGYCPSMPQYALYPGDFSYRYPVAGMPASKTEVYTFIVESRAINKIELPITDDSYIPRITFTRDSTSLAVMTLNREQNRLNIFSVDPKSGVSKVIYKESNDTWIDIETYSSVFFYNDFFIIPSMRSGYRHLYKYSINGTLQKQLTKGEWDVTKYLGTNNSGNLYYQSKQDGAIYQNTYILNRKGETKKITNDGYNETNMNATATYLINSFSNSTTPPVTKLLNGEGSAIKTLYSNSEIAAQSSTTPKEFFSFKNDDGIELNGYMMKPKDFSPQNSYPVIIAQYSGPEVQIVLDKWHNADWRDYMVGNGYIIVAVDPVGSSGRGEEFTHSIYRNLGLQGAKDQIAAANYLKSQPYVNPNSISIYGWSFGGYTTLMAMSLGDGVFNAGVAIAPVTDWRYYNTIYTERYMNTPNANESGYNETSPLKLASQLKGELLLISGTADDNVHFQNTIQYSAALIEANKQFDTQIYPNKNHSINGCDTRLHLFTKVTNFLINNTK